MSATYEFWLTDDAGRRITLLKDIAFCTYSKTTNGFGAIQLGMPYEAYIQAVAKTWQPDWRIDVHRSPGFGFNKRREASYLLRKKRIYDRDSDDVRMIEFFGRSPIDILRRWTVVSLVLSRYTKTDYIDDFMKAVVRDSFITDGYVVPTGEFTVEADVSLGPQTEHTFQYDVILDVIKDLKKTSFEKHAASSSDRRIFFDVVEGANLDNGGFGYIFRTYADLRGLDRTNGVIFSVENGNISAPSYIEDYMEQATYAQVGKTVVYSNDRYLSRWNTIMVYQNTTSPTLNGKETTCERLLRDNAKQIQLATSFLNSPGDANHPRSLYGIDWDFGDLLRIQYAGHDMTAEVETVSVSVDEEGKENILGMTSDYAEGA